MTVDPTTRRRPSIADVAEEAGVSKAAVSKVIRNAYGVSPAMRERVESAINQLEYRPRLAARVMRGTSFTIGFEIPHLGNDFFNQITDGAIAGLQSSGYQLVIAPSVGRHNGASVLESLVDRQVDGIIAVASEVDPQWLEDLGSQTPLVLIGRHESPKHYDTITGDDHAGAELALRHLRELGHQRIAHLTVDPEGPHSPHTIRLETYLDWEKAEGLTPQVMYANNEQEAAEIIAGLMAQPLPPTAIFAGHDMLALGALRAAVELGHEDLAIVGYDGIDLAAHPLISLSTIDQDGRGMGRAAAELLMERIASGRAAASHRQLDPSLRSRRSSRALR